MLWVFMEQTWLKFMGQTWSTDLKHMLYAAKHQVAFLPAILILVIIICIVIAAGVAGEKEKEYMIFAVREYQ